MTLRDMLDHLPKYTVPSPTRQQIQLTDSIGRLWGAGQSTRKKRVACLKGSEGLVSAEGRLRNHGSLSLLREHSTSIFIPKTSPESDRNEGFKMTNLIAAALSTVQLGVSFLMSGLLLFFALRGLRNEFVPCTSVVLDGFSINPAAESDATFIQISGRRQGLISWIMTLMGIEPRVDIAVNGKEFKYRAAGLAGMLTVTAPLVQVKRTICGYQHSLTALFLALFFTVNAFWNGLFLLPILLRLLLAQSEGPRETAAKALAIGLAGLLVWTLLAGIATLFFYFSKRIKFVVDPDKPLGLEFKRSLIRNQVVELSQMEEAAILLNHLVAASCYGTPGVDIPSTLPPDRPVPSSHRFHWWIAPAGFVATLVLAFLFYGYGNGAALSIVTQPAGAAVFLDKQFMGRTDLKTGTLLIPGVTREPHTLELQSFGYQPVSQAVYPGRFESSHRAVVALPPMKYAAHVSTSPGAVHVSVDGQEVGVTNEAGSLRIPEVERGTHQFTFTRDGYRTMTQNVEVESNRQVQQVLVNEADAARQEQESRDREIASHIERGRAFFRQSQYQEALAECEAALKVDPSNPSAIALKNQIEQTRKILGQ